MARRAPCIVCGFRSTHLHHACYRQHCPPETHKDPRNLVPVCFRCHERHHSRVNPIALMQLPDAVFEFAGEVLGARGYDYLRRRYVGADARVLALLSCDEDRNTPETPVNAPCGPAAVEDDE